MRCDLARALCADSLVVFDEFTSVVDRTVAQIGSAALAKAVRRQKNRQFIAVTCHEDVLEWLTPDWTYEPHTGRFAWRLLQRPHIVLDVFPVHRKAWEIFRQYHYMNANLNISAQCYLAEWNGTPVAFMATLPVIGFKNAWRISRVVVLPDYQGIGVGARFSDFIAEQYAQEGKRFRITFSHPALVRSFVRSPRWKLASQLKTGSQPHAGKVSGASHSFHRSVVTFEYAPQEKHA